MTAGDGAGAKHVLVLGSTGSIGRQALEVLDAVPGGELVGLAAGTSVDAACWSRRRVTA